MYKYLYKYSKHSFFCHILGTFAFLKCNIYMKNIVICIFITLINVFVLNLKSNAQQLNKDEYYTAMSSNNISDINTQLAKLKNATFDDKDAFEGALLMKKAGLVSALRDKLNLFKSGHLKLESAIKKYTDNIEYRFLRVIIQENAPKIVHYKNELTTDCDIIKNAFSKLPLSLQQHIVNYGKVSKLPILKELQMNSR